MQFVKNSTIILTAKVSGGFNGGRWPRGQGSRPCALVAQKRPTLRKAIERLFILSNRKKEDVNEARMILVNNRFSNNAPQMILALGPAVPEIATG